METADVDENMQPIDGTQHRIDCDALILSVGLIPENELSKSLDIPLDMKTRGPVVDNTLMTETEGVFSCGNALHVNDLVDYVSESAETADPCTFSPVLLIISSDISIIFFFPGVLLR